MSLTDAQRAERKLGLGGSDAAVVCGLSPYKTPYQLYVEKTTDLPPEEETLGMKFGTIFEAPLVQHYCDVTQRSVRRHPSAVHPRYPWMRANIDRQIIKDPRGPGVLEVKTTNDWTGKGIQGLDDVPDHYYLQAQHYMAVHGYSWGSLAILIGGQKFVWFDVPRNEEVIEALIQREQAFWQRVESRHPPSVDGTEQTGELIKRLYPQDTGVTVTLAFNELIDAAITMQKNKQLRKLLDEQILAASNQIKSAMGEASRAILPGFGEITWKTRKASMKEELNVGKLQAQFPEAYQACVTHETKPGGRVFLVKPTTPEE